MNIYVGNLSYDVTENELRQIFEPFGNVESVRIISDMYSGRSKGFGFVEMSNIGDAQSAINDLNNKEEPPPHPAQLVLSNSTQNSVLLSGIVSISLIFIEHSNLETNALLSASLVPTKHHLSSGLLSKSFTI